MTWLDYIVRMEFIYTVNKKQQATYQRDTNKNTLETCRTFMDLKNPLSFGLRLGYVEKSRAVEKFSEKSNPLNWHGLQSCSFIITGAVELFFHLYITYYLCGFWKVYFWSSLIWKQTVFWMIPLWFFDGPIVYQGAFFKTNHCYWLKHLAWVHMFLDPILLQDTSYPYITVPRAVTNRNPAHEMLHIG